MDQEVVYLREGIKELLEKCEDVELLAIIRSTLAYCII